MRNTTQEETKSESRGVFEANGMQWSYWTTNIDQRTVGEDSKTRDVLDTVLIAEGLATRPFYEIGILESKMRYSATIRLRYDSRLRRATMKSCEFKADELKVSDFHKIPVEKALRTFRPALFGYYRSKAKGSIVYGPLSTGKELLGKISKLPLKEDGPSDDALKWVGRICAISDLNRLPPTKTVSEVIGIPLRTASHWVKLMRERIQPTYSQGAMLKPSHELLLPGEEYADSLFLGEADPNSVLE
ncbi:hypothetical protein WM016_04740 [Bifidobacterium mongoliense]|jgi:sigma-E factor negative regulatory protein RseB|uniref:hypothetical protein n=1 Tax=Bifidobacterium mongoliense TaxID=518643 RepID=UPI0030EF5F04